MHQGEWKITKVVIKTDEGESVGFKAAQIAQIAQIKDISIVIIFKRAAKENRKPKGSEWRFNKEKWWNYQC